MVWSLLPLAGLIACGPGGATDSETGTEGEDSGRQDSGPIHAPPDFDMDGYSGDDCDDSDASIHPGAPEDGESGNDKGNGIDDDCDGVVDEGTSAYDDDTDGLSEDDGDCDDTDASVYPGAPEEPRNGVDENCDGSDAGPVYELSSAEVQLTGEDHYAYAGKAVAMGGDLDGDGLDDLVIGAGYGTEKGNLAGKVYVVGSAGEETGSLADAAALFVSNDGYDGVGTAVGTVDANGDGVADLLIGSYYHTGTEPDTGTAWLFLGPVSGLLEDGDFFNPGNADGEYQGAERDMGTGGAVSGAGDLNGDGLEDILIGAYLSNSIEEYARPGAVYIYHGPATGTYSTEDADVSLEGEHDADYAGATVVPCGDTNNDGHTDLLVGAPVSNVASTNAGAAYLALGPFDGTKALAESGAAFYGEADEDRAGHAVSGAGDLNADGFHDLLIGAHFQSDAGTEAGKTYLFLGPIEGAHSVGEARASITGESASERFGASLTSVGDFDRDGDPDILIGAHRGKYSGRVYLFSGLLTGELTGADADMVFIGEAAGDYAGGSVSGGGDVNGDGLPDLLIGALGSDQAASDAGKVYVVHGTEPDG